MDGKRISWASQWLGFQDSLEPAVKPEESSPFSASEICLLFVALLMSSLAVYHVGLQSPMIYDSLLLGENQHILARSDPLAALALVPDRPLFVLSLYVNYLFGGLDPFYFRVVNAVFLAGTGLMAAFLVRLVLLARNETIGGTVLQQKIISSFAGLLFVLHPLQSLVVLFIWQRQAIMLCLFYYATMALYLGIRMGFVNSRVLGYAVACTLLLCGFLCKENIITLPAALILLELTILGERLRSLPRRIFVVAVITVIPIVIGLIVRHVLHTGDSLHAKGTMEALTNFYHWSGLSFSEVLLTQCRVFWAYVGMIVAPFYYPVHLIESYVVSTSLLEPPSTLLSVLAIIGLLGIGIGFIRWNPICSFSILFFVGVFIPEALCVPQFLYFGYRATLPMLGIIVALSAGLLYLWAWIGGESVKVPVTLAVTTLLCGVVLSLGLISHSKAERWQPLLFWQEAYERLPPFSPKVELTPYLHVLGNYGDVLIKSGRKLEGVNLFRQVVTIAPRRSESYGELGSALLSIGNRDEAIINFRKAIELDPSSASSYERLGVALLEKRQVSEAINLLSKAIELKPDRPNAHVNFGNALLADGNAAAAVEAYQEAIRLAPNLTQAHLNMGAALSQIGHLDSAKEVLERAVSLKPGYAKARANLGNVLLVMGNVHEAIGHLRIAVEIDPRLAGAHRQLARALARTGNLPQAGESYGKALDLEPDSLATLYEFGNILQNLGDIPGAIRHLTAVVKRDPRHDDALRDLVAAISRSPDCEAVRDEVRADLALDREKQAIYDNLDKKLVGACSREHRDHKGTDGKTGN